MSQKEKKKQSKSYDIGRRGDLTIIGSPNGCSPLKLQEQNNKKKKQHVGMHDNEKVHNHGDVGLIWCPYLECWLGLLLCLFSFHTSNHPSSGLLVSVLVLTSWWYMAAQFRPAPNCSPVHSLCQTPTNLSHLPQCMHLPSSPPPLLIDRNLRPQLPTQRHCRSFYIRRSQPLSMVRASSIQVFQT